MMFRILTLLFVSCISIAISAEQMINMYLIGAGGVGSELLNQIHQKFTANDPIEIKVIGIANSKVMVFNLDGIPLNNWKEQLTQSSEPMILQNFIDKITGLNLPHSVFVDCTSNQQVANRYPDVLKAHISIVTPNKKANSGSLTDYYALRSLAKENHVHFLYDANVGAGLPMIYTLQSLKRCGDSVTHLEAILSGTLSYLFNTFDGSVSFSEILKEAQHKGYTEPDPRDDLNGLDMARKFLILAREAGMELEMSDIIIQRFLPDTCFEATSIAEFYECLAQYDAHLSNLATNARQNNQVLRFIGSLENGKAVLSLKAVGQDHPFYQLSDTDNIASIRSTIYCDNPVVIKGPGAGTAITAAHVLSNIIQAGD
jgi:aspartokinase/homoserine dehydrogenase 1